MTCKNPVELTFTPAVNKTNLLDQKRKRSGRHANPYFVFQHRHPFVDAQSLRNLETGVTADRLVNVDKAKEIETKLVQDMTGKTYWKFLSADVRSSQ